MKAGKIVPRFVYVVLIWGIGSSVDAQSLSEQIDNLFGPQGLLLNIRPADPRFEAHTAHFSGASLATLGLLTQQLASSAADFPAISTVPGFTFRYNPQIQAFERSTTSLGPVFVERPQTLGSGKFDLGFSYLFIDFDELEGENLDQLAFRNLRHSPTRNPLFAQTTAEVLFEKFTLQSHVVSFSGTYGLTDRWDVNILVPIVHTSLDIRARARITNDPAMVHFFDANLRTTEKDFSADDSATGVGDLLLRTKYHLFESQGFNLASGLTLRLPTGEEKDFQGIGDTTLTPFFTLSQEYGRFDIHASAGIRDQYRGFGS
jgi:Putative MetA-pathway of phenol degradation